MSDQTATSEVPPQAGVILNADDYAMTRGISDAIVSLAEAGRLSSTSAMVNLHGWPRDAAALKPLRGRLAVGLHLNLTFGAPLGPMPNLAPLGEFPERNVVLRRSLLRALDRREIEMEIARQLDRFEAEFGFPPDFVDGHHHVHVFPIVRDALFDAMQKRFPDGGPLIRDPGDRGVHILRRRVASGKALIATGLARGLRHRAQSAGFPTNIGFSGYSTFGPIPFAEEFQAFMIDRGPRHMIMCHPGLPDDELGERDSIAARRPEEYLYISRDYDLPNLLWRPQRAPDSGGFPW